MPVVESAFVSSLFVQEEGNTISNAPKKEMAKTTNNKKNMILKIAFVDRSFSALALDDDDFIIPLDEEDPDDDEEYEEYEDWDDEEDEDTSK